MGKIQKVAIFGATGMTGLCALEEALNLGLQVKLLLREPSRLPAEYHEKVEIVKGDVVNIDDVDKTVAGVDGVAVVLGTRNDLSATTQLSTGLKNITEVMKKHNIKPVSVCLSAFLFYEPDKVPKQFHDLNAEHDRMLKVVQSSGLNYIAVFPPHIADTPRGEFLVKHDGSPGSRVVSKRELGAFLIESLSQEEHYGHVVGICTKPSTS